MPTRAGPRVGLVVTAEPFYLDNSSDSRALLPDPVIPTQIASLRDLEQLVGYDAATLGHGFKTVVDDPDLSTWGPLAAIEHTTGVAPTTPTPLQQALNSRVLLTEPDDFAATSSTDTP